MFTKSDLNVFAGTGVYQRGEEYFANGAVGDITVENGNYTAFVFGNIRYTTFYDPILEKFSCDCPYGGFCKHRVALGLKILSQVDSLFQNTKTFLDIFRETDISLKLSFLENLLTQNSKFAESFLKFLKSKTKQLDNDDTEEVDIEDVASDIYERINQIGYEDLWDYAPRNRYVDEWEIAEELVEEIIDEHMQDVKMYAESGDIREAFRYLCGIQIGLLRSSDTEIGEQVGDIENFKYDIAQIVLDALKNANISDKKQVIAILFNAAETHNEIQNWSMHERLFDILIEEETLAELLKQKLSAFPSDKSTLDILRKIEKRLGNTDALKQMATENPDNFEIACEYLEILHKEQNFEKVKQILYSWFDQNKQSDLFALQAFITQELGNTDYRKLLVICFFRCSKFETYLKLREIFNEQEAKDIRDAVKSDGLSHQINMHEKWYDDILLFVKSKLNSLYFDYSSYLKDIEAIFPNEAFEIHKSVIYQQLLVAKNRNTYSAIAEILTRMHKFLPAHVIQLAQELYNRKPNLPALRDELRKCGLI